MLSWIIFFICSACVIFGAVVVAFSKHIVRSAFALLFVFAGIAALYAFLCADFLAAAQLVIYAGGIAVLVVFAVMLTQKITNVWTSNELVPKPIAVIVTLLLYIFLNIFVVTNKTFQALPPSLVSKPLVKEIGGTFLTKNLFIFEVTSFVLLVSLIGALYIGRAKKLGEQK